VLVEGSRRPEGRHLLPSFSACRARGQRVGRTLEVELPVFPSGQLTQYIGVSAERRFPMPGKRGGTGYLLTRKCKKPETESVVLLETVHSLFSSEYHKYMPNRV